MRIRQLNHSVYQVQYHIVWGTKYRRKILKNYVKTELIKSIFKIQKSYPDWYIHQINTDVDHVHLILEFSPKYSIGFCVQRIKSLTSADLQKRFKFIRKMAEGNGLWSVGYFVSTIGLNEDQIRKYVEQQGKQDHPRDITAKFS